MSKFSKALKKAEKKVSTLATKAGVGNDLKKAANVFGAANVGGAVGFASGFLTGGLTGAFYGGATGAVTAGIGKAKGDSSSKIISNSAGNALIAGAAGPLIYKPAGTAVITAPGPVSGYANSAGQITVKNASGGFLGTTSAVTNVFKNAIDQVGKGGLVQLATNSLSKLFSGGSNADTENPDYQQGNSVAPGQSFPQWAQSFLPQRSDPTANSSDPSVNVSTGGGDSGGGFSLSNPLLLAGALLIGGYFFLKKGHAHG